MDRLVRKRNTVRSRTNLILQSIEQAVQDPEVEVRSLEELLEQLSVKEDSLTKLDSEAEDLVIDLDDLEREITEANEYKENIITWRSRAERYLRGHSQTTRSPRTHRLEEDNSRTVKLPKLTIEHFDGDSGNWQNFWGQFESGVHSNKNISKVDKFNYLKSFLTKDAANAIRGFTLTSENYDSAVDILKERFGRRDLLINSHMNKLLNLRPVKLSSETMSLRRLYDTCETQVRSLNALGVDSHTYGNLLCPILLRLVPPDIALDFSRKRENDEDWKVSEFLLLLKREVESRERAFHLTKVDTGHGTAPNKEQKKVFQDWREPRSIRMPPTTNFNATINNKCAFCNDYGHIMEACKSLTVAEKRELMKKQGRCFVCLRPRHLARDCKSKHRCSTCQRRHHTSLCEIMTPNVVDETVISSVSQTTGKDVVLLQTAMANFSSGYGSVLGRCLLDGGSQRTFITEDMSKRLRLPVVGEEEITIHTFGGDKPLKTRRKRVKVILRSTKQSRDYIELEALEIPEISSAVMQVPGKTIKDLLKRKGLEIADDSLENSVKGKGISLLIGADYYWKIVTGKMERLSDNGSLMALETKLGWSVHGPTSNFSMGMNTVGIMKIMVEEMPGEQDLAKEMRKFWELDSIGICENTTPEGENEIAKSFEENIQLLNGRYQVKLPWKKELQCWENNFDVAKRRFKNLLVRFQRDPSIYLQYESVINEQLKAGFAEFVKEDDNENDGQAGKIIHYLPHHPVINRKKTTTQLRVVFDGSSHDRNCSSLNECLHSGPNLNPQLLHILLNFRKHNLAVVADIEKAFLQIEIAEEDRDSVRFLWVKGPFKGPNETEMQILRMTRVVFGLTSSPFLLAATIRHHLESFKLEYAETGKILDTCLYVDDFISGGDEVDKTYTLCKEAIHILNAAGMHLRKWQTNSEALKLKWKSGTQEFDTVLESTKEEVSLLKVLGLSWQTRGDVLTFEVSDIIELITSMKTKTKRGILKVSARCRPFSYI